MGHTLWVLVLPCKVTHFHSSILYVIFTRLPLTWIYFGTSWNILDLQEYFGIIKMLSNGMIIYQIRHALIIFGAIAFTE